MSEGSAPLDPGLPVTAGPSRNDEIRPPDDPTPARIAGTSSTACAVGDRSRTDWGTGTAEGSLVPAESLESIAKINAQHEGPFLTVRRSPFPGGRDAYFAFFWVLELM